MGTLDWSCSSRLAVSDEIPVRHVVFLIEAGTPVVPSGRPARIQASPMNSMASKTRSEGWKQLGPQKYAADAIPYSEIPKSDTTLQDVSRINSGMQQKMHVPVGSINPTCPKLTDRHADHWSRQGTTASIQKVGP